MSAMVEICVSELSKLRAKFLSPNPSSSSKSMESSSSSRPPQSLRTQAILKNNAPPVEMSESTVSLLMDRFAPC